VEKYVASSIMKEFRAFEVKGNVIDLIIRGISRGVFGKFVSYFFWIASFP
jgi:large-conductance mechanosensitive channel